MLTINRNITTAFVAGIGLTAGVYFWYHWQKRNCQMDCINSGSAILKEDVVLPSCDDEDHQHTDLPPARGDDNETSTYSDKLDQTSDAEEVPTDAKLMILKHMFLITEGMSTSERLNVYERIAQKIQVIQRAEGLYDVKWKP